MTGKCSYCGKQTPQDEKTCSQTCSEKAEAYIRRAKKRKKGYLAAVSVGGIGVMAGAMAIAFNSFLGYGLLGGGTIAFGLVLLLFGYGTPELYEKFGIRKTFLLVRAVGLVLMAAGTAFLIYWLRAH